MNLHIHTRADIHFLYSFLKMLSTKLSRISIEELYTLHINYRLLILLFCESAEVTRRYHCPSSLKLRTRREIKRACGRKILLCFFINKSPSSITLWKHFLYKMSWKQQKHALAWLVPCDHIKLMFYLPRKHDPCSTRVVCLTGWGSVHGTRKSIQRKTVIIRAHSYGNIQWWSWKTILQSKHK